MGDQNCGPGPQIQAVSQSSISLDETLRAVEFPNIDGQCQPIHDSQLVGLPVAVTGDSVVRSEETTASSVELKTDVKRKRGRPPRGQAKPPPAKKQKEEDEDVCFICFDGGSLVLCDRRGCPKAYHPACIKRDETFFQSKARWNCGWHICSVCQKSAHYMCYTCTYSLCKGCTKDADYLCVRGDKGFCMTCMRTVMLIENKEQGNKEMAQVDFDDKSSWEYLFKVYWIYLKGKLSLTLKELAEAKNPWKESGIMAFKGQSPSPGVHVGTNDVKSSSDRSSGYLEGNNSIRRKSNESLKKLNEDSLSTEKSCNEIDTSLTGCTEWATKELLDFVAHMRNGDTSVLSQFDVQALLLDYIKRNNLRDPRRKSYILCDLKLKTLFGKHRVGHFEMLKLLEFHFLVKEEPPKDVFIQGGVVDINAIQVLADENNNNLMAKDKKRKTRKKGEEHAPLTNLNEYAAIDVHNINLIYLRRDLMENLIEDKEKFHDKVVGSVVRIRISGGEQKQDMYRLVQVVGTTKVPVPYKFSNTTADVMLEVLNLDKKEAVLIDAISNQDFSKDECRRLRQSIKCGLVKRFTVGEIQEKAMALQAVRLNDWLETEMLRLNHLRDRASENGRKKELRECVEKLQLLKTPEEHQRRLRQIPEVHCDPNMDPNYESEEDAGETDKRKQGEYVKPRYSGYNREGSKPISLRNRGDFSGDTGTRAWSNLSPSCEQSKNMYATSYPDKEESAAKALQRLREGKDACRSNRSERPGNEIDSNGLGIGGWNNQAVLSSTTLSSIASEPSTASLSMSNTPSAYNSETKLWHYRDPNGKIQGPFCMVQLQKWSTTGYFPPDMRIWAGDREDDSILLAAALNGQFHKVLPLLNDISSQLQEVGGASDSKLYNSDFGRSENVNATRDGKQTEGHWHGNIATIHSNNNNDLARSDRWGAQSSVWTAPVISYKKETTAGSCSQDQDSFKGNSSYYNPHKVHSPLSSSTLSGAEYATHSHHEINHEVKRCNSDPDHENWNSHGTTVNKILRHSPVKFSLNNLDLNSTLSVTKSTDSPDQNGEMNTTNLHSPSRKMSNGDWEGEAAENKESVSSSVNVHDSDIPDMPSPMPNTSNEYQKCQTVENKQYVSSNVPIQDSGPSWSSTSSLVVGGVQLADITDEWGGYSPTPVKRSVVEWDSNLVSVLSLKPPEGLRDHVATTTSTSGELSHFSLSHPASNISSWQTVSEPIEFSTLAEESVSDLLAEVDAMESQGGLASPTSVMKCGEDLININLRLNAEACGKQKYALFRTLFTVTCRPLGNLQIETNGAHPVRPSDMFSRCNCNWHKWLETELLLLNNLHDRASEKGMYIEISFADQLCIFLFLTPYIKLIACLLIHANFNYLSNLKFDIKV